MKKQTWVDIFSILLIMLFIYAAFTKLLDYEKFEVQLGQSPMLTPFAAWVAWGVPIVEILIALLLAIPPLRTIGLYASFALMVIFTEYIIAITQFADYVPCSCGGILQTMGWTEHLIFNICFVLISFAGIILHAHQERKKQISVDQQVV